jgi:hypothetical protein
MWRKMPPSALDDITLHRKIGITSVSLPRWRTGRGFAGHKLVGHAEQVPQHIRIDARQANQHGVIADVVLCYVVNIGVRGKQLGAVIEIHAYNKRIGFGRAIRGDTRQKFSMDFECWHTVRRALLYAGQHESDIPNGVEVDCAPGQRSARFLKTQALLWLGIPAVQQLSISDEPTKSNSWVTRKRELGPARSGFDAQSPVCRPLGS